MSLRTIDHKSIEHKSSDDTRGVALLIVITILVTMVLVAVPFALSMRQGQERTRSVEARGRAQFEASLLAEIVKLYLSQGHPDQEQRRFDRGERTAASDPLVDTLDELTPNDNFRAKLENEILDQWTKDPAMASRAQYLKGRGLGPLNDDRGSIWTVLVQDAQALVNVNGASPFLLGNLMGSALLSDDVDTGGGDISVDNVVTGRYGGLRGFPGKNGYIRIGREVISYEEFDGEVFRGCERGIFQSTPLEDNGGAESHDKGTPVIDYTAYKLATHLIASNPGQLTPFRNMEALREIAGWGDGGVITAARLERLLPFLTVWSRRETSSGWLADQLVMNQLPQSLDSADPDEVQLRDFLQNPSGTTAYFNPGTIARITNGVDTVYQTVDRIGDAAGRRRDAFLALSGPVGASAGEVTFSGGETTIAAYAPYPININTASREILYAVMANVQFWRSDSKDNIVTPELAWQLAGEIVRARKGPLRADTDSSQRTAGPFRNAEDFGRFLEAKVRASEITRAHFAALYTNAINPHSWRLRFGTAPWCYRSLDVYHVETRVALNNRAGEQIAEAGVREVVEIGSDTTASWVLDSQQDFEQRIAMGSGAKWFTTYPFGVAYKNRAWQHIQPALRAQKGYAFNVYPSTARQEDLGDVRLEPARLDLPGAHLVDHYDSSWYADGWFTGYDGAYTLPVADAWRKKSDKLIRPFSMSFWWRPYSDQDWTVFDAGIDQYKNRIGVFVVNGEQGQELTFRVCAGNMWTQGAEVYVPLDQLDFEPGNWYHIHVSCAGEDPSTMQMLVDGVDIGKRRGFTTTGGSVSVDGEEIPVEDTSGFPIRGSIRIGTEIIEYDTLTETSFRDCVRGARGTTPGEWPNNTPVHMVGYSMPITVPVMKGGASLNESLMKWSAARITTMNGDPAPDTLSVTLDDGLQTPILLAGFGPDTTSITVTTTGMWGQDEQESSEAFGSRGIALMGCPQISNASSGGGEGEGGVGGWEVVFYERTGNQFTIERYIDTAFQGAAEPYFLITEIKSEQLEFPAFLVPISVLAAGGGGAGDDDYLDPSEPEDAEWLAKYYPNGDQSARVLIGTDTPVDAYEVIRYDSIDRKRSGSGILFVRDRSLGAVTSLFFGNAQTISGGTATDPDTDPLPEPEPDDPPPPIPPTEEPTDPGPGDDTPKDPTPGDGVPPGQRDPSDPGEDGPGEVPVPDDGNDPDTGDDEPVPSDGPAGGTDGSTEDDEPVGGGGEETEDNADQDQGDGTDDGGDQGGDAAPGGGVDPGERDPGSETPPAEEPSPDESGGGGDNGSGEGEDEGGDSVIPDQPDPSLTDEEEDEELVEGTAPLEPPGTIETARNALQMRGVNGTTDRDHSGGGDSNSLFLPCFRTFEGSKGAPVQRLGRNDVITLHNGQENDERVQIGVRWGDNSSSWAALDDFIDKRFDPDKEGALTRRNDYRGHSRVMKFPCGEMPDEMSEEIEFGQSSLAGSSLVTAFLDELHVWRHTSDTQLVVENIDGVLEDAQEIRLLNVGTTQQLSTIDGYEQDCGIAVVEGEIVIYRGSHMEGDTTLVLERCARGQLGTRASYHPRGGPVRFLPDIPVSYLDGGMTSDAATISLATMNGWPREGLVRVIREGTAELMHYTRRGENELIMPVSIDADESTRDRGLFRGRFGTDATDHDSDEIVIFQPFRYWDRFTPRRTEDNDAFSGVHEHPEASFFEVGKKVRAGYWRGFTWSENVLGRNTGTTGELRDDTSGEASGFLDVYVLARFNPNVPWDSDQVIDLRDSAGYGRVRDLSKSMNESLFLFDDTGDTSMGNGRQGNGLNLESDTAEFRIFMVFKANAFEPMDGVRSGVGGGDDPVLSNNWKQTPWVKSFSVNYFSRTTTRYRAAVR